MELFTRKDQRFNSDRPSGACLGLNELGDCTYCVEYLQLGIWVLATAKLLVGARSNVSCDSKVQGARWVCLSIGVERLPWCCGGKGRLSKSISAHFPCPCVFGETLLVRPSGSRDPLSLGMSPTPPQSFC